MDRHWRVRRAIHVSMLTVMDQLVGSQELTRLMGVSRARVYQIASADDFPAPVAVLAMGSIWGLADITAWAERKGRTLNLDALTTGLEAGDESTP